MLNRTSCCDELAFPLLCKQSSCLLEDLFILTCLYFDRGFFAIASPTCNHTLTSKCGGCEALRMTASCISSYGSSVELRAKV